MTKQLSSKEIHELREMLRITPNKKTRFDEQKSLSDVVAEMVQTVITNEVLNPPHISCITVLQVIYGGGFHWKNEDTFVRAGILSHAGVQRPPNWYLAEQGKRFGYIMDWPPAAIRNVVTSTLRKEFINPNLDGKIDLPYQIGWCKGYINEENGSAKYVPEYGQFISCYFIMRKERELRQNILSHILMQPWWFRKQWMMMLEKIGPMALSYKRMADKVHSRMSELQKQWIIDETSGESMLLKDLDPQVPEKMIDWREPKEDDDF